MPGAAALSSTRGKRPVRSGRSGGFGDEFELTLYFASSNPARTAGTAARRARAVAESFILSVWRVYGDSRYRRKEENTSMKSFRGREKREGIPTHMTGNRATCRKCSLMRYWELCGLG